MPIDPSVAIGADLGSARSRGARATCCSTTSASARAARPGDNLSPEALRYTLDGPALQVLPSFGVVAPTFHETDPPPLDLPGCDINLAQVVHGSQSITVNGPLPTSGTATISTTLTDIWDKGKACVIWQEGVATSETGEELWTVRSSIFVKGEGGWGGDRGTSQAVELPEREPDADTAYAVTPQQAMLYRLCGDRNPLHADPDFAKAAGFPAPILHGLCSYGIVLRELTDALLGGDADPGRRLRRPLRRGGLPGRDDPGARLARGRPDRGRGHDRRRGRARRRAGARRLRAHARPSWPRSARPAHRPRRPATAGGAISPASDGGVAPEPVLVRAAASRPRRRPRGRRSAGEQHQGRRRCDHRRQRCGTGRPPAGRHSCGRPSASAPRNVPDPAWETTTLTVLEHLGLVHPALDVHVVRLALRARRGSPSGPTVTSSAHRQRRQRVHRRAQHRRVCCGPCRASRRRAAGRRPRGSRARVRAAGPVSATGRRGCAAPMWSVGTDCTDGGQMSR